MAELAAKKEINEMGILNLDPLTYYYNESWEKKKNYFKTKEAQILFWQMPKDVSIPFKRAFLEGLHLNEIEEGEEIKKYFLKNSIILPELVNNPAGFKGMEYFYGPCWFDKPIDIYGWRSLTGQSLRNRLSSTVDFLVREINFYVNIYGQTKILNLGSGLGRDSLITYRDNPKLCQQSKTICVDINLEAVIVGQRLATKHKLKTNIEFLPKNILDLPFEQEFDIGLLVGILCPLSDLAAIKVLKKIKKYFRPEAKLLAVVLTEEMLNRDLLTSYIVREIGGWKKLKFREKGTIRKLLQAAGYKWGGGWSEFSTCFYDFGVGIVP